MPGCLQQFINHSGVLFKVYVMGDQVTFHKTSLTKLFFFVCDAIQTMQSALAMSLTAHANLNAYAFVHTSKSIHF